MGKVEYSGVDGFIQIKSDGRTYNIKLSSIASFYYDDGRTFVYSSGAAWFSVVGDVVDEIKEMLKRA